MNRHPGATRIAEPSTTATIRWLIKATSDLLPPLLLACVLSCLTRFASLAIYLVAAVGLLKVMGLPALESLTSLPWPVLVGAIVLLGFAKGAMRYGEQYVGHRVAFLSLARLRNQIYSAAEYQAPFDATKKNSGGLLAVATRDVDRVEVFFAHTLPPAVAALVVSAGTTWWTWANFGTLPACILLGGYLLTGLVIPALGVKSLRQAAASQARVRGIQNQIITETLAGIDVVHGYSSGGAMLKRFSTAAEPVKAVERKAGKVSAVRAGLTQLAVYGTLLILVIVLAAQGELADMVVLAVIAVPSFEAVRTVDGFVIGLQDSLASAKRLFEVSEGRPQIEDPLHPRPLPATGILEARSLGASYNGSTVLQGLDFRLNPGAMLALVGESGSGKSTAASAIVKAIPCDGHISFGTVPWEEAAAAEIRSRIVLVAQDAVMVRASIRENLLLGLQDVNDQQLLEVLDELGLRSWLEGQKQGLDTKLGDRSTRLSGGQRQRLALARALIRQPAVLIMDESTSALDSHSEQLVLKAINSRRAQGMAVLMISHRISILGQASQVVVLREGTVAEVGTPAELLRNEKSLFARMAVREADKILPEL